MRAAWVLCLLLFACGPGVTRCEEVSSEILADDDVRLGTTAEQVFALTDDARPVTVFYGEPLGGESPLHHVFTRRGSARYVEYEFVLGGEDIALDCSPELRVPVSVALRSDDGRLAEVIDTDLVATAAGSATWFAELSPRGTLRASDFDHDGWTAREAELQLDGAVGPDGRTGAAIVTLCSGGVEGGACTPGDAFSWGPAAE